jgi:hypothetical protein
LPLPGRILGRGQPKAVMIPAEVVGTPERIHPSGQHRFFVSKGASSALPSGARALTKVALSRSIEAVLNHGSARGFEHPGNGLGGPTHHPVHDLDHPPPSIALDDLADKQSGFRDKPRPPATPRTHRVTEYPQKGGDVARQAIHADQDSEAPCTRTDLLNQRNDQGTVAVRADHPHLTTGATALP